MRGFYWEPLADFDRVAQVPGGFAPGSLGAFWDTSRGFMLEQGVCKKGQTQTSFFGWVLLGWVKQIRLARQSQTSTAR